MRQLTGDSAVLMHIIINAANRLIGEVVQSRRMPLLGPTYPRFSCGRGRACTGQPTSAPPRPAPRPTPSPWAAGSTVEGLNFGSDTAIPIIND